MFVGCLGGAGAARNPESPSRLQSERRTARHARQSFTHPPNGGTKSDFLRMNGGEFFTFQSDDRRMGEKAMTQPGANFALIGRSYPGDVFELWSRVALPACERRKTARMSHRAHEPEWSKRARVEVSRG